MRSYNVIWSLAFATYGFVNSNYKWQKQSDDTFLLNDMQAMLEIS